MKFRQNITVFRLISWYNIEEWFYVYDKLEKYTFFPSWLSSLAGFRNEVKNGQVN